jgi:hypothetical protein
MRRWGPAVGVELGEDLGADVVEADADLFHDLDDVGAGLADDVHGDGGLAEGADEAALLGRVDLDGREVADIHGAPVADR